MGMRVSVIGLGYLGVTHAVAMAKLGHEVVGIDPSRERVAQLGAGVVPFFEPGLEEALAEVLATNRLTFNTSHDEDSKLCSLHFLCVGTPQSEGSLKADLSYLEQSIRELAPYLSAQATIVGKSTVPVGTARALRELAEATTGFDVRLVWNPEFLAEGTALHDSLAPDRIVIGASSKESADSLLEAYAPLVADGIPVLVTDLETAELVKVASNSFLATKISFINAVAEVAELSGANAGDLAIAMGMDSRIGSKFLRNGVGYGGGCLPKDVRSFIAQGNELGAQGIPAILDAVESVNAGRRSRVTELALKILGNLAGKRITVLGAAFKPNTDDIRDSPGLQIATDLSSRGVDVVVHDPIALPRVRDAHPQLKCEANLELAVTDADLIILATEWNDYSTQSPTILRPLVRQANIIDGRKALDLTAWRQAGFNVAQLGASSDDQQR